MKILQQSKKHVIAAEEMVDALDWAAAEDSLSARGYAVTASLLSPEECSSHWQKRMCRN